MHELLNALNEFKEKLEMRFSNDVFTSEDNIRYYFVDAIKSVYVIDNTNVILEEKYNRNPKLPIFNDVINADCNIEMDAHLVLNPRDDNIFCEVKYHNDDVNGQLTTTENAGVLINDIIRLSCIKLNGKRVLLYVFENKMFDYLDGRFKNKLNFFKPNFEINNELLDKLAQSAKNKALENINVDDSLFSIMVETVFNESFGKTHIIAYSITKVAGEPYNEKD